jgi:general secretion pathway protein A
MYARYFGLSQPPFSIAPDPRYLFMSERHREALAHLLYGVRAGGGFVVLTGEIGAGKTTICRSFLEQIPERCEVAYIFNPKLTVEELLASVCAEFRIPLRHEGPGVATVKEYVDALNAYLLRTHAVARDNVLIIDEAQSLSPDVLEQLRLLTNLETNERKLLQIVLIGQPELRAMLARPGMEQLGQRVIARYHLDALREDETVQYVRHRLAVAGLTQAVPFDDKALRSIYRYSRGVPRRINLLCDRALLGAYAKGSTVVDRRTVDAAAREVLDPPVVAASRRSRYERAALLGLGLVAGAVLVGALAFRPDPGARGKAAPDAGSSATSSSIVTATTNGNAAASGVTAASGTSPASGTSAANAAAGAPPASASSPVPASVPTAADAPAAASEHARVASAAIAAASGAASAVPATPFDLPTGFATLIDAESASWRELAGAWDIAPLDGEPCRSAPRQQLRCFRSSKTTLALIRQLDRPGILTLRDAENRPAYAMLSGLSDKAATLRIDGSSRTVSLVSLADYWRGEFTTLWRIAPAYAGTGSGSEPNPKWLARQLAIARGESVPAKARIDDETLKGWIHAFQLTQGLNSDGIAGPLTLMQLNRAIGVDEPHLEAEK